MFGSYLVLWMEVIFHAPPPAAGVDQCASDKHWIIVSNRFYYVHVEIIESYTWTFIIHKTVTYTWLKYVS